jgi:hypothetical protein
MKMLPLLSCFRVRSESIPGVGFSRSAMDADPMAGQALTPLQW